MIEFATIISTRVVFGVIFAFAFVFSTTYGNAEIIASNNTIEDITSIRNLDNTDHGDEVKAKIVGGTIVSNAAEYQSFAWTIGGQYRCAGTLIHDDIVLTAAHCFDSYADRQTKVALGGTTRTLPRIVREVRQIIQHPNFIASAYINDIMIVKLNETVTTVPKQVLNFDSTIPVAGSDVTAIGYGLTSENGLLSDRLRQVTVLAFSNEICSNLFVSTSETFIPETKICAGVLEGGKDTCQGDSGGPLLTESNFQVGITSSGVGCARPNLPGLYTRVSAFQTWIQDTICRVSSVKPNYCVSSPTLPTSTQIQPSPVAVVSKPSPVTVKSPTTCGTPSGICPNDDENLMSLKLFRWSIFCIEQCVPEESVQFRSLLRWQCGNC